MAAYLSALGKAARTALTSGRSSEVDELLRLVSHIGRAE